LRAGYGIHAHDCTRWYMPSNPRGNAAKRIADASAGPWKDWRIKTRHGRAIRFIETYCRAPKGTGHGKPLRLARFQKEFLEEALADNVDVGILATPRGNGKSSGGGALAVWALFDDDETGSPQVPIVATTIGQAIRSCYGVAVSMIKAEPELLRRSLIYTGVATPRVVVPFNEGELFPIANDPDGLQGLDPSLAIIDEVGFQPLESFDSLRLASGKRTRSLIVGVGTPGLDRDNALFHLRRAVHEQGKLPRLVFHEYAAPVGCPVTDRKAWRDANPAIGAGFLRESALETDLALATFQEGPFRVFRLGQWVDGVESWLGPNGRAIWDDLAEPYDFVAGAPTWVGVDVGIKRDSTAVVAVQRDEEGILRATCRLWIPTVDEPVDVTDVMAYLRTLAEAYQVEAVSYDPKFFDVPAKMLDDEGLPMVNIPQSVERMTMVLGSLLECVKNRGLRHDGDEGLATHVLNAVTRMNEHGFTLQKSKSRGRIDGVIALSLAVDRAMRMEKTAPVEAFATWA
jgi:phage terminase large subunit-like protein